MKYCTTPERVAILADYTLFLTSNFGNSVGLVTGGGRKNLGSCFVLVTVVTGTSSDLGLLEAAFIFSSASAFSFSQSLK